MKNQNFDEDVDSMEQKGIEEFFSRCISICLRPQKPSLKELQVLRAISSNCKDYLKLGFSPHNTDCNPRLFHENSDLQAIFKNLKHFNIVLKGLYETSLFLSIRTLLKELEELEDNSVNEKIKKEGLTIKKFISDNALALRNKPESVLGIIKALKMILEGNCSYTDISLVMDDVKEYISFIKFELDKCFRKNTITEKISETCQNKNLLKKVAIERHLQCIISMVNEKKSYSSACENYFPKHKKELAELNIKNVRTLKNWISRYNKQTDPNSARKKRGDNFPLPFPPEVVTALNNFLINDPSQ